MYYLKMKAVVESDLKSKTFCISKSYTSLKEKEKIFGNHKSYQKLFVILILLFTILIYPESPRELGDICEGYNNSRKICNVW